jgi:hypothetical protein
MVSGSHCKVKRLPQTESPTPQECARLQRNSTDRDLLYERASVFETTRSVITTCGPREIAMSQLLTPSLDTCLCQGGVGGANGSDPRLCRSLVLAPLPRGTDTACPADRS